LRRRRHLQGFAQTEEGIAAGTFRLGLPVLGGPGGTRGDLVGALAFLDLGAEQVDAFGIVVGELQVEEREPRRSQSWRIVSIAGARARHSSSATSTVQVRSSDIATERCIVAASGRLASNEQTPASPSARRASAISVGSRRTNPSNAGSALSAGGSNA
jgi:hypothetical protein